MCFRGPMWCNMLSPNVLTSPRMTEVLICVVFIKYAKTLVHSLLMQLHTTFTLPFKHVDGSNKTRGHNQMF